MGTADSGARRLRIAARAPLGAACRIIDLEEEKLAETRRANTDLRQAHTRRLAN
ncbi:hypothetical protein G8767_16695 [Rhodococcus sp. IC4_135]|uniref:hypothetical protein n=1 Tax=Rhodococcus TaxID=1827 RepID=UPI00141EC27A|nr:hypothetical protein [Rhodococcus erythropolis]NHP15195.1 hypothetical protein [Rhodococcus sp. IC4_135]